MRPDFFAGFGLKRDDASADRQIHHAVDDDRRDFLKHWAREPVTESRGKTERSRFRQFRNVAVLLRQRGVARACEVPIVDGPVRVWIAGRDCPSTLRLTRLRDESQEDCDCHGDSKKPRS